MKAKELKDLLNDVPDDTPIFAEGNIPVTYAMHIDKMVYLELARKNYI